MRKLHLAFDFDGVFLDSAEATWHTHMRLDNVSIHEAKKRNLEYFSIPHIQHTDTAIIGIDEMTNKREFSQDILSHAKLFSGFIDELVSFDFQNIAIVSSGIKEYIDHFVEQIPIDFDNVLTFDTYRCKKTAIEFLELAWGVDAKEIIFFTDTPSDVIALREVVGEIYGCCWGHAGEEILSKHLDEPYLLREFCDIRKIF
jgi:FMN phosphatase YigB (HAD superfamily)